MRIIILSDTHNCHYQVKLPDGDIFIYCGGMSLCCGFNEILSFANWINDLIDMKMKLKSVGNI